MARPRREIHFKVTKFENPSSGSISWRVTGTKKDGTRIRKNFAEKAEALQEQVDLESEFAGAVVHRKALRTALCPDQLLEAESAIQLLGGESLSKVVAHYLGLRARCREKAGDLDQAIAFFESRYRPEITSITILNATEEFLRSRQSLSEATRANYRTGLILLQKQDPNKPVHAFTVGDIEGALSRYKNVRSQRSFRLIFSVFFHWAVRHHYTLENPCKRLDKLPKDMTQIAMLSLEECKRLLFAAMTYDGASAAATVAIALFAGLRPSEISDLKPSDISEKNIRVTGGKLRRKLKRSVPMTPVLAEWLKCFPFAGLPAGWSYKLKQLKKAVKAAKWVPDILRHTSISFQTERDKNEALTAFNCGTSIQMMNLHYRHTVDNEVIVQEFWCLTPEVINADCNTVVELPARKQANWPSRSALRKLVWAKPMTHAAREMGVSDVALKKRCSSLGIEVPPRGYWLRRAG